MTDVLGQLRTALADRYAVERELGRGGMATVFLATDVKHGRQVAIKVLNPELAASLGAERFLREIQIASRLTHPHILPVHDSGEAGGPLYYVMPYVEGESLRARLVRERQLPVEEALRISCQVASALDYAHRRGVVHRDIKPENVLLEDGHAIVADFGIARAIRAASADRLTETGMSLGTVQYMSPEQAAGEREIDGRSDLYALACVTYEMLAGQPPFVGGTAQSIMARHAMDPVPQIRSVRPSLPAEAETAIMRALAKAPADRYTTIAQFSDALSGCRAAVRRGAWETTVGSGLRRRVVVAGAAGLALAALAAAWWLRPDDVTAETAGAVDGRLDRRRIAVLYFDDLTLDQRLAHVADGLTEALIEELGQVRALDVISPNGVEEFRHAEVGADSIARALRAGTLVEGSVEERGDELRVTVKLLDGATGEERKSGSFERPAGDVLALRDTLAREVANFLRTRLGEEVRVREGRAGTKSAEAWSLVQRAERTRKRAEGLVQGDDVAGGMRTFANADSLLVAAQALDRRWPEPLVQRSALSWRRARLSADEPEEGAMWTTRALAQAESALALDPRSADALELRGTLRYWKWLRGMAPDPTEGATLLRTAEADLRQAVRLNPGQAGAWSTLSHLHFQKPDFVEAKLAARRAYEEDAYLTSAPEVLWRLYTASYELEQPDAAHWCHEGQARFPRNPRFVQCRLWLMTARGQQPDVPEAWQLYETLRELTPEAAWRYQQHEAGLAVAAVIARAGLADSARRVVARSRADAAVDPSRELLSIEAFVHTLLGDKDEALRVLKLYLTANPEHRSGLARDQAWWWRDLRDDPRFQELVGMAS